MVAAGGTGYYPYDIIRAVENVNFLPSYFAVVQKALRMLSQPDVSFVDLAQTLEADQSLVSRLLSMVNSAYYAVSKQVTSVDSAILYLGIKEIRNIVMAAATRTMLSDGTDRGTWMHSLSTAYIAEALAKNSWYPAAQNDAYVAGILHDLGISFINKTMPLAEREIQTRVRMGKQRIEVETMLMGRDHAFVGSMILKKWKLPESVCDAVQYHHTPFQSQQPLSKIIALANQASYRTNRKPDYDPKLLEFCHITGKDLEGLFDAVQLTISEFESRISGTWG